jgi:hypothetical protein
MPCGSHYARRPMTDGMRSVQLARTWGSRCRWVSSSDSTTVLRGSGLRAELMDMRLATGLLSQVAFQHCQLSHSSLLRLSCRWAEVTLSYTQATHRHSQGCCNEGRFQPRPDHE